VEIVKNCGKGGWQLFKATETTGACDWRPHDYTPAVKTLIRRRPVRRFTVDGFRREHAFDVWLLCHDMLWAQVIAIITIFRGELASHIK
jgi:hypothetical protein